MLITVLFIVFIQLIASSLYFYVLDVLLHAPDDKDIFRWTSGKGIKFKNKKQ